MPRLRSAAIFRVPRLPLASFEIAAAGHVTAVELDRRK
jgi:hypothetical protein